MAVQQSRLSGLARYATPAILAAAVVFLIATVFASIAEAYAAGLILMISKRVEGVQVSAINVTTPEGVAQLAPQQAAAAMAKYASSVGVVSVLTALTGVVLLSAASSVRRGKYRGLQRYLVLWGLLFALTAALLGGSKPIYSGSTAAVSLAVLGGLLLTVAGLLPSRLSKHALIVAVVGGLLAAAGVYMGAFPLKESTANFSWLTRVDLGVQYNIGAQGLYSIADPSQAFRDKIVDTLKGDVAERLDELAKLLDQGKASQSQAKATLREVASTLKSLAGKVPSGFSTDLIELAGRAESLADSPEVTTGDVVSLRDAVVNLAAKAESLGFGSKSVGTGLEVTAAAHPVIVATASVLGATAYFARSRRGLILAVALVIISAYAAYATLEVAQGPVKAASSQLDEIGRRSLEIRSYPTWKTPATSLGLAGLGMWTAFLAAVIALIGGLLYLAGSLASIRPE